MLDAGHWFRVPGFWPFVPGHWLLAIGSWSLVTGLNIGMAERNDRILSLTPSAAYLQPLSYKKPVTRCQ